eukprot:CAMPEP_0179996930 /NCGR_PEP_ID=MMETSP0984-20121128/7864_1 /TAXON_ID=483367 /ORGANISM="non described non described, Strain CCMP 2436" /LENGTH=121 /DNA_ID=CAMNT_0021916487 /DNA_START=134 /DNA_END=496 /DNA_ORIENTATION=-
MHSRARAPPYRITSSFPLEAASSSVPVPRAAAQVEPGQCVQLPVSDSSGRARACCELALPVVDQLLEGAHTADGRDEAKYVPHVQHEVGHALTRKHRERARAEEVRAALLLGKARVVAEGP